VAAEEVSLESLGATEASPPAVEVARDRVQSADMEDLEIVEIGSEVAEITQEQTIDEPVPESAPRPAVQSVEVELEPPIKTPPPESGRQAVTPPPAMADARPAAPTDDDFDEDDLLETDASGKPISISTSGAPTMGQLGDTVQIAGASEPPREIELDVPSAAPRTARIGEYEAEHQHHREVPPEPREASSRRVDPLATTVPDVRTKMALAETLPDAKNPALAQTAPDAKSPFADAIRATTEAKAETPAPQKVAAKPAAPAAPELVVERPVSKATHAAEVVVAKPRKVPETFLELLDASLELRA
jgi:hypothetical protein